MPYPSKLFALLGALVLTGCAAPFVRVSPPSAPLAPPQALVKNCNLIAPPNVELYSLSTPEKKEELLYTFSMAQMDSLVRCNEQQESLRLWISEQLRLYLLTNK